MMNQGQYTIHWKNETTGIQGTSLTMGETSMLARALFGSLWWSILVSWFWRLSLYCKLWNVKPNYSQSVNLIQPLWRRPLSDMRRKEYFVFVTIKDNRMDNNESGWIYHTLKELNHWNKRYQSHNRRNRRNNFPR